jgi:prepilin-type N-terminal cleavage/methylation domain-containing protein
MFITNCSERKANAKFNNEEGFSLLEVVVAMLVMTVLLLGTLTVFTYTVQYNRGNYLRSQALSVLQKEAEVYRSGKFVKGFTDTADPDLTGGTKANKTVSSSDGTAFVVSITVDDNPSTPNTIDVNTATTIKEIKINVTPQKKEAAWVTAISVNTTIQRVRGN